MATPEIGDAIEASNEFIMDEIAYRQYLQRESAIWDYNTDILTSRQIAHEEGLEEGRKEGREKGREEGREEGREKRTEEMVRDMLGDGMSLEKIAKFSKWSMEKIHAFAAKDKLGE